MDNEEDWCGDIEGLNHMLDDQGYCVACGCVINLSPINQIVMDAADESVAKSVHEHSYKVIYPED